MRGRDSSRFECPSSSLQFGDLLRKTREVLWIALLIAVGIHFSLTSIGVFESEEKRPKPLTTRFVKRQPRLTKPLELKKRPRPKRRHIQRAVVSVKARAARQTVTTSTSAANVVQNLARPVVGLGRTVGLEHRALDVTELSQAVESSKEPKQKVDMGLELLDVEALDTGQYQAMVLQDPTDKRSVRGFFHVAIVGARTILDSGSELGRSHDFPRFISLIPRVMNQYTDIKTDVRGHYGFDSPKFLETPFIFITTDVPFELTDSEAANLGKYLVCGGLAFVEPWVEGINRADVALRKMLKDAFASHRYMYGRDWSFQIIPKAHAVYHCYFDFDGPPAGHDRRKRFPGTRDYLEEIVVHRLTACIYSNKDLEGAWSHDFPYLPVDNTVPHRFLVNLIIFALTQEGSITHRLMESVR